MIETIAAMAVVTFLARLCGLELRLRSDWAVRAIALVPVAAFAALVSTSLEVRPEAWSRWAVVALGGWLAWRGAPVWISVAGGLLVYFIGTSLYR